MIMSRRAAIQAGLAISLAKVPLAWAATIALRTADGRQSQISTWEPAQPERGVVLFSHGALSAPGKYQRLLGPWSAAGFRILAPLHVDSTDHPDHGKYDMVGSWRARLQDMRALADYVKAPGYIAAGHSYGGLVALTLGGALATVPPGISGPLRDMRAQSAVAFSPPGPSPGLITAQGYGGLAVPAFIETGTKDIPMMMPGGDWRVHLAAYDAASPGKNYALVLTGADHYFGGIICRPELPGPPQTAAFETAVHLSTDFMKGYGAADRAALGRLDAALSDRGNAKLSRK